MEFIRQIINSSELAPILTLPPSFYDLQVEVIVLPVDSKENASHVSSSLSNANKPEKHSAYGRLNAYAKPELIQEEGEAWEKEASEKYALR